MPSSSRYDVGPMYLLKYDSVEVPQMHHVGWLASILASPAGLLHVYIHVRFL